MYRNMKLNLVLCFGAVLMVSDVRGLSFDTSVLTGTLNDFKTNLFGSTQAFIKNKTESFWRTLTENDLRNIGKTQILDFLSQGYSLIPARVQELMRQILRTNASMTIEDLKAELQNPQTPLSDYGTQLLVRRLPDPRLWTGDNVTAMYSFLKKMPHTFLMRISNKTALDNLKSQLDRDVSYSSGEDSMRGQALQTNLFRKMNEIASSWTNETFAKIDLAKIPAEMFKEIRPEVLASRKQDLINIGSSATDPEKIRMYLEKLLQSTNLKTVVNPSNAMSIADSLSALKDSLIPEDFSDSARMDPSVEALLDSNINNGVLKGVLSPMGVRKVMSTFFNMDNITAETLQDSDLPKLGLLLPSNFTSALQNKAFSISGNNVDRILAGMGNLPAFGSDAKIKGLARLIEDSVRQSASPFISQYNEKVLPAIRSSILNKLSSSEAKNILMKNVNMDKVQTLLMLDKVATSDFSTLSQAAREQIPLSKLESLGQASFAQISQGLPPQSVVAMETAEKTIGTMKNLMASDVNTLRSVLPFIGGQEAMLFNETNIMESLTAMKDINPSAKACMVLKEKVYNYTKLVTSNFDQRNPISHLLDVEFENIPVCVLAAYGPKAIATMSSGNKAILLQRLGKLKDAELSVLKQNRMAIIQEGLGALGMNPGLELGELDAVGNVLADIPATILENAEKGAALDFLAKMNKTITINNGLKPCLDSRQMAAVAKMMKTIKGSDPSQWTSVRDVCCLLYTMPATDLKAIKKEVLLSCTCRTPFLSPSDSIKNDLCKIFLGAAYPIMEEGEMNLKNIQMDASLALLANISVEAKDQRETMNGRKKRATTTTDGDACNKAGLKGAAAFTESELRLINENTIISCLQNFGAKDMDQLMAQILSEKIRTYTGNNLKSLTTEQVEALGFIFKGFSSSEFSGFPAFKVKFYDDVVAMLGKMTQLTESQVNKLANKIKDEWISPSSMTGPEVQMINNLICGFESADVNAIPKESIQASIGVLSKLNCSSEVMQAIVNSIKYSYGPIEQWGKSKVAELDALSAGLAPQDFIKIKPEAMEGITRTAILRFDKNILNSINLEQFKALNPAAVLSLTKEQQSYLTEDMMKVLNNVIGSYVLPGKATSVTPAAAALLCVLIPFLF